MALFCISSFALIFTKELLHVKQKAPFYHKLINASTTFKVHLFYSLLML
ncbi:hypothetical protein [Pedobacter sp. SL55]|nr:hypothetical protein [Pedobacter sp. SL55]WAC39630.1 hypothetical protein OVA16_13695 [Pedobacter sp. SL55]